MASASEIEIREAVVARCRKLWPEGRIIHELAIGGCRVDVAVVTREHVFSFEIKSEKDTLSRLANQVARFQAATHGCFVVAHEKWFERFDYDNGVPGFRPGSELGGQRHRLLGLWCYPEEAPFGPLAEKYRWKLPGRYGFYAQAQPKSSYLLGILLRGELLSEARRHDVPIKSKWPVTPIIHSMAYHMSGAEIARATCRQLRMRSFAKADPPVLSEADPVSEACH